MGMERKYCILHEKAVMLGAVLAKVKGGGYAWVTYTTAASFQESSNTVSTFSGFSFLVGITDSWR
jgi:hypothetical protein